MKPDQAIAVDYLAQKTKVQSKALAPSPKNCKDVPRENSLQMLFKIDCGYLIGIYDKNHAQSAVVTGILLNSNGSPVAIARIVGEVIINEINKTLQSNPFFYFSFNGMILMNFKISQNNPLLTQYFASKVQEISLALPSLFSLYGVRRGTSIKCKSKISHQKMDGLIAALKAKQKIIGIIKKQIEFKNKDYKRLKHKQGINNGKIEEVGIVYERQQSNNISFFGSICQRFSTIVENQIGKDINKSQKFSISKGKFSLTIDHSNATDPKRKESLKNIQLVKKMVKTGAEKKIKERANRKLRRQIHIVSQIQKGQQYFMKYYISKDFNNTEPQQPILNYNQNQGLELYMQYAPSNLAFILTNSILSINQLIVRFKEIVEGVEMLHLSGIVHRDLKPQNILLYDSRLEVQNGPKIKIIDFSDSALINQKYSVEVSNSLGSSLPYSPFQCSYSCQFGFNSPYVDIWSLGVLLYEFIYKEVPCLYYQNTSMEQFQKGIAENQLSIVLPRMMHNKGYFGFLEEFLHLIISNCLILVHYERMETDVIKQIVSIVINFLQEMEEIVESSSLHSE